MEGITFKQDRRAAMEPTYSSCLESLIGVKWMKGISLMRIEKEMVEMHFLGQFPKFY